MDEESVKSKNMLRNFSSQNYHGLYDAKLLPAFTPEMFDVAYWEVLARVKEANSGRGAVWYIRASHINLVLRHFRRGGLIARIIKDWFFLFGAKSRVEIEQNILMEAYNKSLPVPRCVGYRVQKWGVFCKMDILMEEISEAENLFEKLLRSPVDTAVWENIGSTIRRLHNENFIHGDLNVHNILVDASQKIWIIDFDKASNAYVGKVKKLQNLERLKRSLNKELKKHPKLFWQPADWQPFMNGYRDND